MTDLKNLEEVLEMLNAQEQMVEILENQQTELESLMMENQKLKEELYNIISTHSGQPYDKVWADSDRDYWMTSKEALDYGMIDKVLEKTK